jgi:MoxR-like ATPase
MNESQVTVEGRSWPLERPFMVIATQNPVEHHGTYPLPESQLDRFLMRLRMGYPDPHSERQILRSPESPDSHDWPPVVSREEIVDLQDRTASVSVDEAIVDYLLAIVERTRTHESLALGVSPRGARMLYRAAQALALVEGRNYAIPDDIQRLLLPVCAHRVQIDTRVSLSNRTAGAAERILGDILAGIEVPL